MEKIEYQESISKKVIYKLNRENYLGNCLRAKLCPKCGAYLLFEKEDRVKGQKDTYKCTNCDYIYEAEYFSPKINPLA